MDVIATAMAEPGLETKAVLAADDMRATHDTMLRAFEEFKATQDEKLAAVAHRGDVLIDEKVERLNAALDAQMRRLDELALKAARPPLAHAARDGGRHGRDAGNAFARYIRAGDAGGFAPEMKAMALSSPPDGGYLVPPEVEAEIGRRLAVVSPIRAIAGIREVSATVFKKPFMTTGPAVGWVGETDARAQTATPAIAELAFPTMELYAMPAATTALLDDAAVNLDEWIAGEVELAFAEQEGAAFVNGDGVTRPQGFMSVPRIAEANWSWGKLGFVLSGVDGGFPAAAPVDPLIDLVYALKAGYRQNATFVMNRKTQAAVRKLKDADGNYVWLPPAQADGRASLLSFPVVEAEEMPDMAADACAIAFGDFRRGYLIVDRLGVRVLRDPYSAKPYVLFYTTKRVGGGVQDFDAIKLMKFGDA